MIGDRCSDVGNAALPMILATLAALAFGNIDADKTITRGSPLMVEVTNYNALLEALLAGFDFHFEAVICCL